MIPTQDSLGPPRYTGRSIFFLAARCRRDPHEIRLLSARFLLEAGASFLSPLAHKSWESATSSVVTINQISGMSILMSKFKPGIALETVNRRGDIGPCVYSDVVGGGKSGN